MKRFALLLFSLLLGGAATAHGSEWREVEEVFRSAGEKVDNSTFKMTVPRIDQTVTKGDVKLTPEFGLTNEIVFIGQPEKALVTAELVLMEREVQPVITQLQAQGFEISALHNHLLGTDPPLMYLHVHGSGTARGLAIALKAALAETGVQPAPPDEAAPAAGPAQWAPLQSILGHEGKQRGTVLEVEMPRRERVTEKGVAVPPSFGAMHRLLFQKSGEKVAVAGEFVLLDQEVNRVAKLLQSNRFEIDALHNHHLFEHPRLFHLHFWGSGSAEEVAKSLRQVLEQANAGAAGRAPATGPGASPEGSGSGAAGKLPAPSGAAPPPARGAPAPP